MPVLLSSTYHTPIHSKLSVDNDQPISSPSHISLKALQDIASVTTVTENHPHQDTDKVEEPAVPLPTTNDIEDEHIAHEERTDIEIEHHTDINADGEHNESVEESIDHHEDISEHFDENIEETTSVEQRLKKISEEIKKYSSAESEPDVNRPSFFSLSDLIKTLRPSEKVVPQIDSDYSNTMRVLGETSSVVSNNDDNQKTKDGIELKQANRALY